MSIEESVIETYFSAIETNDSDKVRELLSNNRKLTTVKRRGNYHYDASIELDAYKFLGAYLGALSGLHLALLLGHESIARDITDVTFDQDLNLTFGDNNTTLHLAVFLECKEVVQSLLERGVDSSIKNGKNLSAVDVSNDPIILDILQNTQPLAPTNNN
ncbi:hypothetical protein CONCODRAFT_76567 [Conidiobolus coronatus NRRL 28638]|uniref:Uncharacterized protein n=1 Tax=Conidiobolus coronatus (strain ATCC 28846 / CBS 209.66 / NRRL 28638) TaxID=796925 RepID=A0A137PJ90_CONC2|nr:hypothetical protein CONCODRAFT_76567 [Conidiobolus coronatus NRRL 28638]|eukprot:KXN75063.1 hypothetical protein CONCODRAFT_76567 [Conidiobolus coronatus NRRL 28638]